jgi:hypothetical protein
MEKVLKFIEEEKIVCPMPIYWGDLYGLIKRNIYSTTRTSTEYYHTSLIEPNVRLNDRDVKNKFGLSNPLILNGWYSSNEDKKERFLEHIKVANENNIINKVEYFLFRLDKIKSDKKTFYYEHDLDMAPDLSLYD